MSALTIADVMSRTKPMAEPVKKKGWIKKATANSHGQFRAKAEKAGMSTRAFAKAHEHDSGKTGAQARLAENLMGLKKKSPLHDHPRSARNG